MKKNPLNIKDFKLLNDNVLVKSILVTEKKGVIVPTTYDTKPELGEVISVGSKVEELLPKDIVYFNKYSSTKFNVDGEEYYVLRFDDVVGYKR